MIPVALSGDRTYNADTIRRYVILSLIHIYLMIRKEQICKIRTPFPVDFICCEILIKFIVEYFMRFSVLIFRLLWADNGICLLYTSRCV